MNPHNPEEFAAAFAELDATTEPAEIRAAFERDDNQEPKAAKHPYKLVNGELTKIDGDQNERAAQARP